jgi:hypothetical protein
MRQVSAALFTAFSNSFNPPSTPLDQNAAWQAVNKRLNATLNFNVVARADYAAKTGTIMAGDDLHAPVIWNSEEELYVTTMRRARGLQPRSVVRPWPTSR